MRRVGLVPQRLHLVGALDVGELAHGARAWQVEEWGFVALALDAGIIATVIPAWRACRQDVVATLADG